MNLKIKNCYYADNDNKFDLDSALIDSGHYAGVCYNKEGLEKVIEEIRKKTEKRIDNTLENGHHSVCGHIYITVNMEDVPKSLAMVLNNEKDYNTSEKSARYTPVISKEGSIISEKEQKLYDKWVEIFKTKIKNEYGDIYPDTKITKLAQENARYLVTVHMPTQMVYTTNLRQWNYLARFLIDYYNEADMSNWYQAYLAEAGIELVNKLDQLNMTDERLLRNEKNRKLSLFADPNVTREVHFGDVYSTNYKGSFAELAQAQRHRTLSYEMKLPELDKCNFFVPPILEDDLTLVYEWLNDCYSVEDIYPQGMLLDINERGTYENFILKCQERLCSAAQLEICNQTKDTLLKYKKALEENNHYLAEDIEKYSHGARCTFPGFKCSQDCHNKEGKLLIRKI
ncbi:MAG: FAD-dependent thymidylate synthase [Bacilli bacterium]